CALLRPQRFDAAWRPSRRCAVAHPERGSQAPAWISGGVSDSAWQSNGKRRGSCGLKTLRARLRALGIPGETSVSTRNLVSASLVARRGFLFPSVPRSEDE